MAVKIRLARHGAKKRPYYRVVVADSRMPRDGRYIEEIGAFNPVANPKLIKIDLEKVQEWVAKGAKPTNTVAKLIKIASGEAEEPKERVRKSKKQIAKEAAAKNEA